MYSLTVLKPEGTPTCMVVNLRKVWSSFGIWTYYAYYSIFPFYNASYERFTQVAQQCIGSFSTFTFMPVDLHRSYYFAVLLMAAVLWLSCFPSPFPVEVAFPSISSSGCCLALVCVTLLSEHVQVGCRCGKRFRELLPATGKAALRESGTALKMISPSRKLALLSLKTSK